MQTFLKKYKVGWGDIDVNYRLTGISAIKFFQETFSLYCAAYKVAAFDIFEKNMIWVISDLQIDFKQNMPYWSEDFTVEIWISEKTKIKTFCDFKISYKNQIIAQGESCWYILDIETRKPIRSNEILKELDIYEEKIFGNHDKYTFDFEGNLLSKKYHEVTITDLDFNRHVNNLSYIGLFEESIPVSILEKYSISLLKVRFVKEACLNDDLCCEIYENQNEINGKIYRKNDNLMFVLYLQNAIILRNFIKIPE